MSIMQDLKLKGLVAFIRDGFEAGKVGYTNHTSSFDDVNWPDDPDELELRMRTGEEAFDEFKTRVTDLLDAVIATAEFDNSVHPQLKLRDLQNLASELRKELP